MNESLHYFRFDAMLQREDWLEPAYLGVDPAGVIRYLSNHAPGDGTAIEAVTGFALPGFLNGHSHAFQYAMAGAAENHPPGTDDDFWTWREEMYKCALSADPDQVEAIAAMLYAEMLRHGYTHVAEFHYLHHDKNGKPYSNLAEMGERILAAASTSGIKVTLIPVFYQKGGFGAAPQERQRRFISKTVDEYFKLLSASEEAVKRAPGARLGFSVHSLRAVDGKDIKTTFDKGPKGLPFHLHVAEQKKEVEDCIAFYGKRPMQWVLENLPVGDSFFLVHSTHLDDDELKRLSASGANVVLCPSTEGNLGDGIFRMKEYCRAGGHWCIGTDSHIGLNPYEEFRMIDYRQRLVTNKRNTFAGDAGKYMINEATTTGRKAMGVPGTDHFAIGQAFDAVIVDPKANAIESSAPVNRIGRIVFTGDAATNIGTIVNGKWIVKKGIHFKREGIRSSYREAIRKLG